MITYKVYLELLNMCSISYFPNVILPLYVTMVTHQNWPWPVKFTLKALGGAVVSEMVYLVFHISLQIEVTWNKVWVSKGPTIYHLRCDFLECCWQPICCNECCQWKLYEFPWFSRSFRFVFVSIQKYTNLLFIITGVRFVCRNSAQD
jgi:hypothetical protein